MMAKTMDQKIVVLVVLLCLFADSNSQPPVCSDPNQQLVNTVVYEGESSSFSNQFDPNNVTWGIAPSFDPYGSPFYTIADDNVLQPEFINAYAVTPTLLSIPTASVYDQPPDPYSTSGLYVVTYKTDGCQAWANFIVVIRGPECLCTETDPDSAFLSCEVDYGVARVLPNYATMTWYDESGSPVATETPNPDQSNVNYSNSTSVYPITSSDAASYTCRVTFTAPDPGVYDTFATNAPSFNASCTVANCVKTAATTTIGPDSTTTTTSCQKNLVNIVVNEGSVAEFENADDVKPVKWHFSSSSDPQNNLLDITDYDNKVNPMFVGAYNVTRTKLTIISATVAPKGNNPYSTAGVYFLTYQSNNCQTAANLIVIQSGPVCDRNENDPNNVLLSCNISYAESERQPSYPTMTWTTGNVVIETDQPTPQKYPYVYESLSQIPPYNTAPSYYQCQVTFNPPAPVAYPIPFLAQNSPSYTGSCTVASGTFPPIAEIATTTVETTSSTTTTQIATTTAETTPQTTTTETATTTEVCVDSPTCSSKWLSNQKAFCPYIPEFEDDCPAFCGVC